MVIKPDIWHSRNNSPNVHYHVIDGFMFLKYHMTSPTPNTYTEHFIPIVKTLPSNNILCKLMKSCHQVTQADETTCVTNDLLNTFGVVKLALLLIFQHTQTKLHTYHQQVLVKQGTRLSSRNQAQALWLSVL